MSELTRRRFLGSGLALGLGAVAGCTGSPGGAASPPTDSPTETRTPSGTDTETPTGTSRSPTPSGPVVTEATLHTGEGSCGDTANAEITRTDDGIRVEGAIVAPTPCYEARLKSFRDEDRVVTFTIDVEESSQTDACVQCIGEIRFELTATFARGTFDAVVIDLRGTRPTTVRKDLS